MSFLCAKQPMKIAVLANEGLTQEIQSKRLAAQTEFVWLSSLKGLVEERDADIYFDMEFDGTPERTQALSQLLPRPVLINSVVLSLTEIGMPFIRINGWPGFIKRPVVEIALSKNSQEEAVRKIFHGLEWEYRIVPDTAGMISARIIAMIINEAYYTFVSLDPNGKPRTVPQLIPETEGEKKLFESALRRRQIRLILGGKMKADDATELRSRGHRVSNAS